MSADTSVYTNLVTAEHADKPNFMAMVAATVQPFATLRDLQQAYSTLYDLDSATGEQLDVLGQWIGVSRQLNTPLTGVYFAFDTAGVGFDQGIWQGQFDPSTGLVSLPDDYYRLVLRMRVLNNHWNGSKEDAYRLANTVFAAYGYQVLIEDHGDLTMSLGLVGPGTPTPILQALLTSGKLNIKPVTVHINYYISQTMPGPVFGLDVDNTLIGGFDHGSWANAIAN